MVQHQADAEVQRGQVVPVGVGQPEPGRLRRRHAMQSHNLEKKSAKRHRAFRSDQSVDESDVREVKRLLGR